MPPKTRFIDSFSDRMTQWIGSTSSLILHTLFFALTLTSHWFFGWSFDLVLLILTTVVSLEAIYLAIFIQRAVNQQGIRLDEVEDSIDEVEEALDDVEESLIETEDDIADIARDTAKHLEEPLDELMAEMRRLLDEYQSGAHRKKKPE